MTVEQKVAHVEAEGAADVAAAVGQRTRQAAAVEGAEGVGAAETQGRRNKDEVLLFPNWRLKEPLPVQVSPPWTVLGAEEVSEMT